MILKGELAAAVHQTKASGEGERDDEDALGDGNNRKNPPVQLAYSLCHVAAKASGNRFSTLSQHILRIHALADFE